MPLLRAAAAWLALSGTCACDRKCSRLSFCACCERLEGYQAPCATTLRVTLQALQPVYATEHRAAGACRGFSLRAHGLASSRSGAAVESPAPERGAAANGEPAPAPPQPSAAEQAPAGAACVSFLGLGACLQASACMLALQGSRAPVEPQRLRAAARRALLCLHRAAVLLCYLRAQA